MGWTKTTTKMYLKKTGSGKGLSYPGRVDGTYTLVWERADAQQRLPREEPKTYPALLGFIGFSGCIDVFILIRRADIDFGAHVCSSYSLIGA